MASISPESELPISPIDPYTRQHVSVLNTEIAYIDEGAGDPIVFLHGNPTSSYLWRNIIPHVADLGRCLAPDLVGMGRSQSAPDGNYRFSDQVRYLDAWFEAVGVGTNITLVLHDWGSALGFHWAERHRDQVKAIAYTEAIVQPLVWADFPRLGQFAFRAMRSAAGEWLVLNRNVFIELILPKTVLRKLTTAERDAYRAPFPTRGSRKPLLAFPRELPIEGTPADVVAIVKRYGAWLATTPIPKLLITAHPGALLTGRNLAFARRWPNQREITVTGSHYVQEDCPHTIGTALRQFILTTRRTSAGE